MALKLYQVEAMDVNGDSQTFRGIAKDVGQAYEKALKKVIEYEPAPTIFKIEEIEEMEF